MSEKGQAEIITARILHAFPTFAIGGAQMRLVSLAKAYGDRFHHSVVAMDSCIDCRAEFPSAIALEFPAISVTKGGGLANVWAFRGVLKRWRPDLLITYNWGSIEWALAAGLLAHQRHIHIEDGFGPGEEDGPLWRRSAFRRLALRRAEAVIVPSKILADIAATAWKVPAGKLAYIPNGIDCQLYRRAAEPGLLPESFVKTGGPIIGTIATLRAEKNIVRLLSAFRAVLSEYPAAKLIIVGDGAERAHLERAAAHFDLRDRVAFTGNITGPERIIGHFDIFALSSDTEQMPISILEAMAAGLPIAATDVGDVASMVSTANLPFVVSKDNDGALGGAIIDLLDSPAQRVAIGAANRDKARADYDLAHMLKRHLALWQGKPGTP